MTYTIAIFNYKSDRQSTNGIPVEWRNLMQCRYWVDGQLLVVSYTDKTYTRGDRLTFKSNSIDMT